MACMYPYCLFISFFYYPLESFGNSRYGALSHAFYFSMLPLQLLVPVLLLKRKASYQWMERYSLLLRTFFLAAVIMLIDFLIHLPFRVLWYMISRNEGTRTQLFWPWLLERLISSFITLLVLVIIFLYRFNNHEAMAKNMGVYALVMVDSSGYFHGVYSTSVD